MSMWYSTSETLDRLFPDETAKKIRAEMKGQNASQVAISAVIWNMLGVIKERTAPGFYCIMRDKTLPDIDSFSHMYIEYGKHKPVWTRKDIEDIPGMSKLIEVVYDWEIE